MINDGENDSVVTDETCELHPGWNASVCAGDVGRLSFSAGSIRGPVSAPGALRAVSARIRPPGPPAPPAGAAASARPLRPLRSRPSRWFATARNSRSPATRAPCGPAPRSQVKTERPEVSLSVSEMDQGSWVIFELPGFTKAASGTEQASMDALRRANETSYFRSGDALWVKLVAATASVRPVRPTDMQASIAVSR